MIPNSIHNEGIRLAYGVATDDNTVTVDGSTAVLMPAINPVKVGDYCAVLVAGGDRIILGSVGVTSWTQPTLLNSWVDFGGAYALAAYRKVGDVVELRGLIKSGSTNAAAFTLPTGFRPPAELIYAVATSTGPANIAVQADGDVFIPTGVSTTYVSLAGISFSVT